MNIVQQSKDVMLRFGASPIMYLMLALSIISVAVVIERGWFFASHSENLERLAKALAKHLASDDVAGALRLVTTSPSVEAAIVVAGLKQFGRGAEAAAEAMAGATAVQRMRLEQRLSFLGTLGNNAPFIGLLGTVIGIVQAFDKLQSAGASPNGGGEVMGAIAEALVATAIGLVVAIPAVAAFNYFQRRIRSTLGSCESLTHIILAHLKGTPLPVPQHRAAEPSESQPARCHAAPEMQRLEHITVSV